MWPWIRENLGLAVNPYLTDCGTCYGWCCNTYGFTVLRKGEAKKISTFLDMSLKDFRSIFTITLYDEECLAPADPCPFWANGCCEIQPVKPNSCMEYIPRLSNAQICSDLHVKMANKR